MVDPMEVFSDVNRLLADVVLIVTSITTAILIPVVLLTKSVRSSIMVTHVLTCAILPLFTFVELLFNSLPTLIGDYSDPYSMPAILAYESLVSGTLFLLAPAFPFMHLVVITALVEYRALRYIPDLWISVGVMLTMVIITHLVFIVMFINPDAAFWPWETYHIVLDGIMNPYVNSVRVWYRAFVIFLWAMLIVGYGLRGHHVPQTYVVCIFLCLVYLVAVTLSTSLSGLPVMLLRAFCDVAMPIVVMGLMLLMPVALWPTTMAPVLHNPIGCRAFLSFLETEYSGENLRYILALRRLQLLAKDTVAARSLLDRIMSSFIRPTAAEMINLPDPIVRAITEYHAEFTKQCEADPSAVVSMAVFQPSIVDVSHMLEDSFTRFRQSSMYSTMVRDMQQQRQTLPEASVLSAMVRAASRSLRRRGPRWKLDLGNVTDALPKGSAGLENIL